MVTLTNGPSLPGRLQASYRHLWTTLETRFQIQNQARTDGSEVGWDDLLDSLRSIKNSLVGSRPRKLLTITDPEISPNIGLLASILEWNEFDLATLALKLEAAAIVGLLCIPEDRTVLCLLRARLPAAIIDSITTLLRRQPIESMFLLSPPARQLGHNFLHTLLRTLSAIYSIVQDVSGSRKWGYMTKSPERIHKPRVRSNSKLRRSSATSPTTPPASEHGLKGKYKTLLNTTKPLPIDSPTHSNLGVGESDSLARHLQLASKPNELKEACDHAKALLFKYLVFGDSLIPLLFAVSPPGKSATTNAPAANLSLSSAADLAVPCFQLTWLLCQDTRRQLWLVKKLMDAPDPFTQQDSLLKAFTECLKSWLGSSHDQAVEYCIRAGSALLSIDEPPTYPADNTLLDYLDRLIWDKSFAGDSETSHGWGFGWVLLASKASQGSPTLRAALATSVVGLVKNFPDIRLRILTRQIRNTIALIDNPSYSKTVRAEAAYALAHAVTISETLQLEASEAKVIPVLKKLLDTASAQPEPYATPAIVTHNAMLRESAYLALASLMSTLDTPRQDVIDLNLLPSIVKSLEDDSILVKAAACQCCRALSRAISILRTKLTDEGAGSRLFELALGEDDDSEDDQSDDEDEDAVEIQLKMVAMGAVCNLVLDFSPMKIEVLNRCGIEKFVKLLKSTKYQSLRESALWALKNMTFSSSTQLKLKVISQLGWDEIIKLLEDKNSSIQENVISLLRNVACGEVADIDLVFRQLNSDGRLLNLLEDRLNSDGPVLLSISNTLRESVILQTIYTFSNIATGNEHHKNFLLSQYRLLGCISELLRHSNPEIRIGALWCVINLTYFDETAKARIATRGLNLFESFGLRERLEELMDDHRADVRERAGCALNQLLAQRRRILS